MHLEGIRDKRPRTISAQCAFSRMKTDHAVAPAKFEIEAARSFVSSSTVKPVRPRVEGVVFS